MYRVMIIIGLIFVLVSCGTDSNLDTSLKNEEDPVELTKISNTEIVDQNPSNHAKEILQNYDDISKVKAINTSKILLIAIDLQHSKRFNLAKAESDLTKKMKKSFPNLKVEFSTDQKIILELDQLEKDIQDKKVSNKELDKRIKHLVSLNREQT